MEEEINLEDVDNFLDGYEQPELHKVALINLEDDDFYLESEKHCIIPQVDGLDDISIVKKHFSVNCEIQLFFLLYIGKINEISILSDCC